MKDSEPIHNLSTHVVTHHQEFDDNVQWLKLLDELIGLIESQTIIDTDLPECTSTPSVHSVCRNLARYLGLLSVKLIPLKKIKKYSEKQVVIKPKFHHEIWPGIISTPLDNTCVSSTQIARLNDLAKHMYFWLEQNEKIQTEQKDIQHLYQLVDSAPLALIALDNDLKPALINKSAKYLFQEDPLLSLTQSRIKLKPSLPNYFSIDKTLEILQLELHTKYLKRNYEHLTFEFMKLDMENNRFDEDMEVIINQVLTKGKSKLIRYSILIIIHSRKHNNILSKLQSLPVTIERILEENFLLSEKERILAWNIGLGMSLQHYALYSNKSVETIRSQLKSIYRKLSISDQKSLSSFIFEIITMEDLKTFNMDFQY